MHAYRHTYSCKWSLIQPAKHRVVVIKESKWSPKQHCSDVHCSAPAVGSQQPPKEGTPLLSIGHHGKQTSIHSAALDRGQTHDTLSDEQLRPKVTWYNWTNPWVCRRNTTSRIPPSSGRRRRYRNGPSPRQKQSTVAAVVLEGRSRPGVE